MPDSSVRAEGSQVAALRLKLDERGSMGVRLAFGAELRRLRQEAGMTLQQLAYEIHYSKSHLCKIERGDKRPPTALVRRAMPSSPQRVRCGGWVRGRGRPARSAAGRRPWHAVA